MTPNERLLIVAEIMRGIPKETLKFAPRFDMGEWFHLDDDCGTVACACGFAALDPRLQADGLRMITEDTDTVVTSECIILLTRSPSSYPLHLIPFYDGEEGWVAIRKFFGLDYDISLFESEAYKSDSTGKIDPIAVAERIEEFVRNRA